MINGVIVIKKEKGFTSHDVVAKLRGIVRQKKIGHTGTLDPDAEGVLPVCLGNATKLCDILTDRDKEYVAKMRLGVETDTLDITGTVLKESVVEVTEEMVKTAVFSFLGHSMQIPPMYSALKVNGKKLYELAREGKVIERQPRPIEISDLEILSMELPFVTFRVACSKGTYIRSLCADIGEKLGCGACMESLTRTKVGIFTLDRALTLSEVETLRDQQTLLEHVLAVDEIYRELPAIHMREEYLSLLLNGNSCMIWNVEEFTVSTVLVNGARYRMYHPDGRFFGIYEYVEEKDRLKPYKMFIPKDE